MAIPAVSRRDNVERGVATLRHCDVKRDRTNNSMNEKSRKTIASRQPDWSETESKSLLMVQR